VDSMALTEITQSADIIDEAKAKAIDHDHKELWAELYDTLTLEEGNNLYFTLKKITITPGKIIIQQGKLNNKLFFIDQAALKIVHNKKGHDLFLKDISRGELSGKHTFFTISVATASTIAKKQGELYYLEREKYDALTKKHPGIDRKIQDFSKQTARNEIRDILKEKELERRIFQRRKAQGKVAIFMLDSNKQPAKTPIYGILEEISEGGLSLSIKTASPEKARLFLGKFASLKIISKTTGLKMGRNGIVLSVYNHMFNDYTMSFRFLKPVPLPDILKLTGEDEES
jgi:CRP-like cAMP-binding protein